MKILSYLMVSLISIFSANSFANNPSPKPIEFSYTNALLATLKLTNLDVSSNEIEQDALKFFEYNVWQEFKNDEFELQDKVTQANSRLKDKLDKIKLPIIFDIRSRASFGEYNFDKQEFAFEPMPADSYGFVKMDNYRFLQYTKFPTEIRLFTTNNDEINGLPMEKEKAKKFLQQRKKNGYPDRNVMLAFKVQLESADDLENLRGKILSYTVKTEDGKTIIYQKSLE